MLKRGGLRILFDGYEDVEKYIRGKEELVDISSKTMEFLSGFYSDFALELLSSVDYLVEKEGTFDKKIIVEKMKEWNDRKSELATNDRYLDIVLDHLKNSYRQ